MRRDDPVAGTGIKRLNLFLPYLAPYPSAGSLRADSFIFGLVEAILSSNATIELHIYTVTKNAEAIQGARIHLLPFGFPDNTKSFVRRFFGEILLGILASLAIVSATRKKDAILMSSPPFLSSLLLGLSAALFRRKYFLDIRDIYPLVYADAGLLRKDSWLFRSLESLERVWLRKASIVTAATRGLARHVEAAGALAPVVAIYNGFPAQVATVDVAPRARFSVCFHGILGQFQDIESVVEVARQLAPRDIDVVVVGYGSKAALLEATHLPNLEFLGRRPFEETVRIVASCQIGLCLRRDGEISRDAFPVKVWECLGLGLPVIVTPYCEAGTFLEEAGCGVQFEAAAIGSIVSWIVGMRDDLARYDRYVEQCKVVRRDYTRERMGTKAAETILRHLEPQGTRGRKGGSQT